MPKRRAVRSPSEEEQYQLLKLQRKADSQRRYRQKVNDNVKNISNNSNNNVRIEVDSMPSTSLSIDNVVSVASSTLKKIKVDSFYEKSDVKHKELDSNSDPCTDQFVNILSQSLPSTSSSTENYVSIASNEMRNKNVDYTVQERQSYHFKKADYQRNYRKRKRNFSQIENLCNNCTDTVIEEHYSGEMNILCKHCNAKHFKAEQVPNKKNSFNDCCKHGKVILEDLPKPPLILQSLFDGTHELSNHFHERVRCYNNSFAFASFNANLVDFNNTRPGPYCFKIHGQVYYQMNTSIYAEDNSNPSFGQLFIVDQNESTDIRCNQFQTLNRDIINAIDTALRDCNIFVQSYRMMHEEMEKSMTENNLTIEPEMQLLFTLKPGMDSRRYNIQKVNEVAAIFTTTADGDIPESYVTLYNKRNKNLQYVSSMNPNVEPWIYPLFYPYGTRGWDENMTCVNSNKRVSRSAYIKFKIASRDDNVILKCGRLFQQWIVDNYVKVEKDRTNFCRNNQSTLRAESYKGLIDHLQRRADESNSEVGKIVILPSSFTGSPRNMLQNYQDAMAIVRKFGKPDLFITMTCNPNWREIQENLLPHQTAADRPDIVSRVFNIKKNEVINVIVKEKLFGEILAYVYVVEYQKRGLPHMHLLVNLKQNNKITTSEIVDKYISAEIPDPSENPVLHDIVMRNMIHGPCGSWCKDENGKCSKSFPKKFCSETIMDENGYPSYRRRNNGTFNRPNRGTADNQYVVPYNPTLLQLFNFHINVEVVSSIKSVKYLYKYIYKGHDAAAIEITDSANSATSIECDEI
ncbi:uncharacterized protein LOC127290984 [Leptopilina boulardi]|uniref:uncharacterized protein LOC127281065 n=1 Tax=Leptopilina boulardi TaxID=63433 RepID=UPI0021F53C84|nr:uncharacterized protein LOC127281065 [Leptopilina boulardi]XP_051175806.1 uncharacterized protein LOC127290984 [Leptopilina boulardi]